MASNINVLTLEIFTRLMSADTVNPPGHEKRGAECLKEIFDAHGLNCTVQDLGNNRANFICVIGSGDPVLDLCGHLDVVPAEGRWKHPPLASTEEDGLIFGRGSCDMKGGVAAMCAAALSMAPDIISGGKSLRLVFVADEEHANTGMHAFQAAYPPSGFAVLGEPTSLEVAVAHRGTARFYVDFHGAQRHAALRSDQESAVVKAARGVLALEELNKQLAGTVHDILPSPSVCVTQLSGYQKDNVVPGTVTLLTDFRTLPGTSDDEVRSLIENALTRAGITDFSFRTRFSMPGGEISADDPFVGICLDAVSSVTGHRGVPVPFGASCEQCFLEQAGTGTVILGPGSLDQAHTVDEYVEKKQLLQAAGIYAELIRRICL